ncbi:DUF3226 domain-containing protein [Prochlorothrix hollandica]|uniref:DUF3226 domain-containing protein n=1 Tax=Prochlorothrix hollandica TaxID=1223 RepID=UPI00034B6968|nr:DUF3226 domain-containing protein [Prochlorothrix hollandica]
MANYLIVESKNDQYFIKALVKQINASIDHIKLIYINEYEPLQGLDHQKLKDVLSNLKAAAQRGKVDRVGIILDLDQETEDNRLQLVNQCLAAVFENTAELQKTCEFIHLEQESPDFSIQMACYFTHVQGQGELETLLKSIKTKPSPYADCLQAWRECLATQGKPISDKEFDKLWVAQYIRWDTCTRKERKQAERKCSMAAFKYVMEDKTDIWDWSHAALDGLKQFLQLFSE